MKKQILSIFLLFFLIAPAVVTYSWLQHRKSVIKKEVKWKMIAGIDKKELVLLSFSKKETTTKLNWKHSKEFEYNDEMYDIVDKVVSKDSIQFWCWWDFKETRLNKQLDSILVGVYQHDSKSKEKEEQIHKFYKSIYLQSAFVWNPFLFLTQYNKAIYKGVLYNTLFMNTIFPPPKLILK